MFSLRPLRLLLVFVSIACGGCETAPAHSAETPQTAPRPEPAEPPVEPAPPVAHAVEIVVLNDTDATVALDRSFGPGAPFSVVRLDGSLDESTTLDEQDDERSRGWISTCGCYCGGGCAQCEPPGQVMATLAPGERYRFPWSGLFRRNHSPAEGRDCFESFAPPAGRYVFTVCARHCARRAVELPTDEPIELHLGAIRQVTRCAELDSSLMSRVGRSVRAQIEQILPDRPVSECPETPHCVEPERLEETLRATQPGQCALLAIPRGDEVEYRVFLPLPPTHLGGESFSNFYDADGSRVLRSRFEQ